MNGVVEQKPDPDTGMFCVRRDLDDDGRRKGMIVKLTDLWQQVELIPFFGRKCPRSWNSDTAVEKATEFIVNCFSDREFFACMI